MTNKPVGDRQQRVHHVLDPHHRDALRLDARQLVDQFAALRARSARRRSRRAAAACGSVASARASSSRLRSSSVSAPASWLACARRPVCSSTSLRSVPGVALALAAAEAGRGDEVLEHRHAGRTAAGSGRSGRCQPAAPVRRQRRDVAAVEHDAPGVGAHVAADQVEQRGLARAVGPEDAERLAGLDGQRDVVGDLQCAVGLADAIQGKDRHAADDARDAATSASSCRRSGCCVAAWLLTITRSYLRFVPFTHWPSTSGVLLDVLHRALAAPLHRADDGVEVGRRDGVAHVGAPSATWRASACRPRPRTARARSRSAASTACWCRSRTRRPAPWRSAWSATT